MLEKTSDLLKQIALGEDSILELKNISFKGEKISGPHRNGMADELAAMANTHAGIILLGVDDRTREVVGIPLEKLDLVEDWLRAICNDLIEPPLDCLVRKLFVPVQGEQEKVIIRVDVPRSLFVHQSPGGYFRRIGSSKRQMKPDMLARLFQQRSQARLIRFDEQAVPGARFDDLAPSLWNRFRTVISSHDDQEFLLKMKLISPGENDILCPTVSGVLMACETPDAFMSGAFIQAVCYRGIERNGGYQLDAKDISGPLDIQVRDACRFVERNMRVYAIKAPNRIDTPQFSLNAVFEAVVNAVAHRDYSIYGSKIRLHLFADRLEIFSPGTIPNTMTIDSLSERQSARNELLTSLLARCPMNFNAIGSQRSSIMDKRGEGVPIIIVESEQLSGVRPEYRLLDDAELKLTIYAAPPPPEHG
ncbi:putative transcriptional regulator, contains HTH domain [Candidatus Electrothrix marina]|uniref:Putative transcriptional regulator, contains HTH domain n=1 Tax=Candidatus Electrothrix marina TaxID=1859130 RepID=A0A444JGI4_9BACT|nr:putative transcriptional regulator, contains HTH domain [Candidatus Electrothrix marina]